MFEECIYDSFEQCCHHCPNRPDCPENHLFPYEPDTDAMMEDIRDREFFRELI